MSERAVLAAAQRGGVASWAELREHATGHEIRKAVASGALSRKRRDTIQAVGPIFEPQVRINVAGRVVRPDLVQESLRIVIQADSHAFHTSPAQIRKDCWRYDELNLDGWLVLRFAWEQVLRMPQWVQDVVRRAVELQRNSRGSS